MGGVGAVVMLRDVLRDRSLNKVPSGYYSNTIVMHNVHVSCPSVGVSSVYYVCVLNAIRTMYCH